MDENEVKQTEAVEEAEGLDLREQHAKKEEEMKQKYQAAIIAIAEKHHVDVGVAFDMLKAVARGGNYAEGIDLNVEELKNDYIELLAISEEIAKAAGNL